MAGAGFKTFVDGDILTAAQVNTYLMEQSVMVFASAAARTTAIASPSEGMVTYRTDDNVIEYYDGAAWQPILDQDVIAAKGDLIVGTGDDTVSRLAVGTNNQVLTADSSTATGLKWAASSNVTWGSHTVNTSQNTTSATYTNLATTGPTVTITTGTKALVIIKCSITGAPADSIAYMACAVSGATTIAASDDQALEIAYTFDSNEPQLQMASIILYTSLTAGSNTFTAKYRSGSGTVTFNHREMFVLDLGS